MKERVTLKYKSSSGQEYLYDDCTGNIFVWNEIKEKVLEQCNGSGDLISLKENLYHLYDIDEVDEAINEIDYWINNYYAFYRDTEQLKFHQLEDNSTILEVMKSVNNTCLISLTDQCNLNCKYCIYSDEYSLTKLKSNKKMMANMIEPIIEFYSKFIQDEIINNPIKMYNISFYGGEPLLNLEIMLELIDRFNDVYPGRFLFNITTNGLKLDINTFEKLMERNVNILVSLDGEEKQHDRLRVDYSNQGSFKIILKNLYEIKEKYPEYYFSKIGLAAVYDICTDIIKNNDFFEACTREYLLPPIKLVNGVSNLNTTYYEKFTKEDVENHRKMKEILERKYINNILDDKENNNYLIGLFAMEYLMIIMRKRVYDVLPIDIPFGGTCFPGQKIFIDTNGTLGLCERVNGSHSFGNIYDGVNEAKIEQILTQYKKEVLKNCSKCPVSKICSNCFNTFECDGNFKYDINRCNESITFIRNNISKYSTLLEKVPKTKLVSNLENLFKDEFINL
ncbi:radical SAM protein [Clostridium sp. KNHs205]|uniref:radical SAM protein n=1 Tax=Clostridium sp. KNHs205 TaxID=1449050 RepID=UPI00051AD968|nr:radical SAM protein [Clostridium sp. KNHs205]